LSMVLSGRNVSAEARIDISEFKQFRKKVAFAISDEIGKHFNAMSNIIGDDIDVLDDYERKTRKLKIKYADYAPVIDFLYLFDDSDEVGYKVCKQILELLNRVSELSESDKKICAVLEACYQSKRKMYWIAQ